MTEQEFLKLPIWVRFGIFRQLRLYMTGVNLKPFVNELASRETLHQIERWVYWGVVQQFNSDWFVEKCWINGQTPPFKVIVKFDPFYQKINADIDLPMDDPATLDKETLDLFTSKG